MGAVVRIAGLLHLGEHGEAGHSWPVRVETIKAAERIGRYFKAAAINVFNQMGTDPDTADAVYLLGRVEYLCQRGDTDEVSARELFTASSRPRFPDMAAMMPALKRLVEHGYLIQLPAAKPTGGRPASPRFKVHPLAAQAAKPQKGASG